MTLQQDAAGLVYGNILEFVEIDLVDVTGGEEGYFRVYNSFNTADADGEISFLGVDWMPLPFTSEGWVRDGSGGEQRPTITFSDFDGLFLLTAMQHHELVGARVRRWETTSQNRNNSYYGPETFILNQIMESNGDYVKIGLANPLDFRSRRIPGVIMRRDRFPALGYNRIG